MAISFVQDFTATEPSNASVVATVPVGGVAAGNHLIIAYVTGSDTTTVTGATDTASNTYTVHATLHGSGDNRTLVLLSGYMTSGLSSGNTVTVNLSGADGGSIVVSEFSGLASSTYFDKTAQQRIGFDATHSSGLTATTTQADELLFGAHMTDVTVAWTATNSFTVTEQTDFFSAWRQICQYKVVAATGTYESTGTDAGATSLNIIGTFKAAAGGTDATVTAAVATSTAAVVAPPKPRPTAPFSEINVRM